MSQKDNIIFGFCKYIKTKSFLIFQIIPLLLVTYILTPQNIYAISISDKYRPITEKWSELNVGGEIKGFRLKKDGTIFFKNKEFETKLMVSWGSNGKWESVPPEKIFISPTNPSGKLVFMQSNVIDMPFSGLYIADIINRKLIKIDPFYHYGVNVDWLMWSPNEKYALLYEIREEYPILHRIDLETGETKIIDLNYLAKGVDEIIEYDMSSFIWIDYNALNCKVYVKCSEIARGLYGIDPKIKEKCDFNSVKPSYTVKIDITTPNVKLNDITKLYVVDVDGSIYTVIKTSDNKIFNIIGGRGFLDQNQKIVDDPIIIKKLVKTSWVYETFVKETPYTLPVWSSPNENIRLIEDILSTFKEVKTYEMWQDLIVRTWVDIAVIVIAGPTSTANLPKLVLNFTVQNVIDVFASAVNLKNVLSLTSIIILNNSISFYRNCQKEIDDSFKKGEIDYNSAEKIYNNYYNGLKRNDPFRKLIVSFMPKKSFDLVLQGLKSAGKETIDFIIPANTIYSTEASRQFVDYATMYKGLDYFYSKIEGITELKEYREGNKLYRTQMNLMLGVLSALEEDWINKMKDYY